MIEYVGEKGNRSGGLKQYFFVNGRMLSKPMCLYQHSSGK